MSSHPRTPAKLADEAEARRLDGEESRGDGAARYRALVETATDWLWETDREANYTYSSPRVRELLGYEPAEVIGRKVFDFMPPEEVERLTPIVAGFWAARKPFSGLENWNRRKDGSRVLLETSGGPFFDAGGEFLGYRGIDRDITEHKRAEEARRASEENYRALIETTETGYVIIDSAGLVSGANPEYVRLSGHQTLAEIVGRSVVEWTAPHDRERNAAEVQKCFQQGFVRNFETDYVDRAGRITPIEVNATVVGSGTAMRILTLCRDISLRKAAEQTARARQAQLASIFRAAPSGIGVVENRCLLEVNDRVCGMTGYSREELVGQSARILYPSEEEFEFVGREKYRQIVAKGTGTVETRWRRKDGTLIDVILSSTPIEAGNLAGGVTFTATDITERRRAEEERRKLEAQMQQAQKLESLGVLAGGIAHDFNNLLTAILGHANLALVELAPESPGCDSLREIENAARRAAELCRQMLAYAGRGRFVVEPVNLSRLVQELVHLLHVSLSKKALLRCHLEDALPAIVADPAQLRQVVMNLVINASEAIGDNEGVIGITTGAMDCTAEDLRSVELVEPVPAGRYVFLELTDTGCGMDAETRARIFDPFFSTKFAGRGLGLAAVLGIVRKHKGALKVTSERGRGTTFRILFPATVQTIATGNIGAAPAPWKGAGTVLLVDDEEPVRFVASRMLEHCGFRPLIARDGREAVELFQQHGAEIVCVLLDLAMPRMDGEETFRELRKIRSDVRVILTSGYSDSEIAERFPAGALAGALEKPFQLQALSAKLREVLGAGARKE